MFRATDNKEILVRGDEYLFVKACPSVLFIEMDAALKADFRAENQMTCGTE